jgi:oxaloacetate decarboxylase alpha subunit
LVLRDAHQSLFATRMLTADMLGAAEWLDHAGYWSLETWGGATFDACIRFLNEDPWERLTRLKAAMPHTPMQMLLRGQNLLGYRHYADDVVEAFVACAARRGVSVFRVFDALNDPRNLTTAIRAVKRAGQHAQATISYAVSPVHTLSAYAALSRELKAMGADSICVKDMAGLLRPYEAADLVKTLKAETGLPVQLHTHATTGMSVATLVKGIEAGADRVDTAISSMAMGTSHSPTETLVEILRGTPWDTGLDLKLLGRIAAHFRGVRTKYRKFESSFLGADTRILTSQVPGGMLSNLESQLKEAGKLDNLDAVLDEIAVVQREFGYPPLVTPTSQIVGTQAVFNVLFGRHARLTAESRDLLAGRYGRTPADPDPDLVQRALTELKLDAPVRGRPADDLPNELGRIEADLKTKLGTSTVSVEDVLTYAMFPQVAPGFFAKRAQGPVSFDEPAAEKPAPAQATAPAAAPGGPRRYVVAVNGREYTVRTQAGGDGKRRIEVNGAPYDVAVRETPADHASATAAGGATAPTDGTADVLAPMPGDIVRLDCEDGARVEAGQTVVVMEAMKMQIEVKTRRAGAVTFKIAAGERVKADQLLARVE